ncbi:helix-turn-helix domain-containing protein [Streptomyces aureocirculatus]|uniref:helix-turn-helix domain-containing protein n=1 Tax=Streptomyces aureocirculatus TaxID=67275 RepID=UPI00068A5E2B|nr:helix-turn-helix transcriptional regulator [Streptomyces aureocirculatus]
MAVKGAARGNAATGRTTGFVLRMARESANCTQAGMAEAMGVDLCTWQGWETGRRSLAHVKAGAFLHLRRRLLALGTDPQTLHFFEPAMDADRIISGTLHPEDTDRHPLADWVHTRDTAHMISWALNGRVPPALAQRPLPGRRGPVAKAPVLPAPDRAAFFAQLRNTAESALHAGSDGLLLHRQALYLCSYDRTPDVTTWMSQALHARRGLSAAHGWTPHWATARSTATALVRLGDPQPLLDFIDNGLAGDDAAENANLNYWAYWLGALREPQPDDGFMRHRPATWEPVRLLHGLVTGLHQASAYVDLYAHSLWALLTIHRWLPLADPRLANRLASHTDGLLDRNRISPRSRRELSSVHYVLRENRT